MIISREELQITTGTDIYDGKVLHSKFRYKFLGKDFTNPQGDIIGFRAPMCVEGDNLVDQEDRINKDFIYSEDAINFLWEIPNLDAFGAVAFQRLFNTAITALLSKHIGTLLLKGDDILIHVDPENLENIGKLSVSIAYSKNGVAYCHTGININAGNKAPTFAYSTHLTDEQITEFMDDVNDAFYEMVWDINLATSKVDI